ncbi:MAG TPA: hypothetical protein VKP65_11235 [Rhodothermales bacterium]|nr:hypothetical protein [Rhodothermales bacterium]
MIRNIKRWAMLVFMIVCSSTACAQEQEGWVVDTGLLDFADYPAEPYNGKTHETRICSEKDWTFRTRLRQAAGQPPNFAGHFHLTMWGCGTGCLMGAAVDVTTGEVFWVPGTLSCAWCAEVDTDPLAFEPDSHLLILRGTLHRDGISGEHYYAFENGSFVHLRTVVFD